METTILKQPSECRILIVDDEKKICQFLRDAIKSRYQVTVAHTAREALTQIALNHFDVVIADLVLPDGSGMDVLETAKKKDEFAEGMVITGNATLETSTQAIDLGVSSYLIKPVSLEMFVSQVEKAVAHRIFHFKSQALMLELDRMSPDVKGHLRNITMLYQFSRKLLLSLEVSEIMKIILTEVRRRMDALFCCVGINYLDFVEMYAMPGIGGGDRDDTRKLILSAWNRSFSIIDREQFRRRDVTLTVYDHADDIRQKDLKEIAPITVPMMVRGNPMGFIAVFRKDGTELGADDHQFLYVFTSIISSILSYGYLDMQAKIQARTDGLTRIANHRAFKESLKREVSRAKRSGARFCLALIDIDNFKMVNDTYGHLIGDAVLVDLTRRISAMIRQVDMLARYGGEEFALILPDTDREGGRILAQRVREMIASQPVTISEHTVHYTISIGVSVYDSATSVDDMTLLGDADSALYQAKREGKNRVCIR